MNELTINIRGENVDSIIWSISELPTFLNSEELKSPFSEMFVIGENEVSIDLCGYEDYPNDQVNF